MAEGENKDKSNEAKQEFKKATNPSHQPVKGFAGHQRRETELKGSGKKPKHPHEKGVEILRRNIAAKGGQEPDRLDISGEETKPKRPAGKK